MNIGLDIMGGDFAPQATIKGVLSVLPDISNDTKIILFGCAKEIKKNLDQHNSIKNIEIIDCAEKIEMGEHPTKALRLKPNSSIAKGFDLLSKNKIDAFASAGNTGAMFVGGFYSVKPIDKIIRPAISTLIPKENGGLTVLLDVGANADCKPEMLDQFGVLGSIFATNICDIKIPKVSLLNLGAEKNKGNKLTQSAYSLMENNKKYNFIGNIEARDIFNSNSDVIVCDGFTGNIVLKEIEAFYNLIHKRKIKDNYFEKLNYEKYGGTPILGLKKPVIIGHGISNHIAIKNMIHLTKKIVEADITSKIINNLK